MIRREMATFAALLVIAMMCMCGCGGRVPLVGGAPLTAHSPGPEVQSRLVAGSGEAAYVSVGRAEASFILRSLSTEPSGESLEQVVRVSMLWLSKAGATPMDSTATNASLHWIVRAGDEVGVYAGAGFARLNGRLGTGRVSVRLESGSMRLIAATEGFRDPISPGLVHGEFTAANDPEQHELILTETRELLTERFGRADALPRGLTGR